MKYYYLLLTFLCYGFISVAQSKKELTVVIVSCQAGSLLIDGVEVAIVAADDASRQTLSYGDHYIQVKTSASKYNTVITIDENTKNMVRVGCDQPVEIKTLRLLNKQVSLTGAFSQDMEQNIFALDAGDELLINSNVINAKGTATLFVTDRQSGFEIYRKQDFRTL